MKSHIKLLKLMGCCSEAISYAEDFPNLTAAWKTCERGDWLLWFAGKCSGEPDSASRKKLVLASCKCARLSLKHTKDPRVKKCIVITENYANGKHDITLGDVRNAADAAYAAYAATTDAATAYADTAYAAATAAAYAAATTDATTDAATATAAYAATADAATAYASSRAKILKQCAKIVREFYPVPPRRVKGVK